MFTRGGGMNVNIEYVGCRLRNFCLIITVMLSDLICTKCLHLLFCHGYFYTPNAP